MDLEKTVNGIFFVGLVLFSLVALFFVAQVFYIPIQTAEGTHRVQITAVESSGIFFITDTVYVKSDTASSQEEKYCLDRKDPDYMQMRQELTEASRTGNFVVVQFKDYLSKGITRCNGEAAVITEVN